MAKNVLGGELQSCCTDPMTGFYRTGYCQIGPEDHGIHSVCIKADVPFLKFSKMSGNDISTPVPEYGFPGVKPGDHWCLCVSRWIEALDARAAPEVDLEATHISTLEFVNLEELQKYAVKK
ncbi:MAG: DUF2237 domain-containing protein [Lentisphaeraceae bacterium]|nr:DUF2237 domain-containing protein [Lentisphaeraceae bacterium]